MAALVASVIVVAAGALVVFTQSLRRGEPATPRAASARGGLAPRVAPAAVRVEPIGLRELARTERRRLLRRSALRIPWWRRVGAGVTLVVISVVLGLLTATAFGLAVFLAYSFLLSAF